MLQIIETYSTGLKNECVVGKSAVSTDKFLEMVYPILLKVMHNTAKFDCGMIENSGCLLVPCNNCE